MAVDQAYYFKFNAPTWLAATSKIQLLNYEEKGIFIELCAMLLMENGRIKNDAMLHRKLRIEKAQLTNWLNLLSELNLLVSDGEYLSVKFIDKALFEMKTKSKILSQNGAKGGRPKSQQKPPSQNENKNYIKENIKEKTPTLFLIPEKLNTPEFRSAWEKWESHCVENNKPLRATQRDVTLMKLAREGNSEDAIAAIENSIQKKLTVIYPPWGTKSLENVNAAEPKFEEF